MSLEELCQVIEARHKRPCRKKKKRPCSVWWFPPFSYCKWCLLWTLVYKHLSFCFRYFGDIFREVELLDHMLILCVTFWGPDKLFHRGCTILYLHQQCINIPVYPHLFFLIIAILMGLKWEMVSHWAFSIYLKHTCYPVSEIFLLHIMTKLCQL